ncbi:HalOD1 output domain-containing protein [Natronococcus wangiae]|uniref:HalOD1 output domain-containing protein n=1 Tax=Natronococcus wangiae TaxID=3068275 RepID=UPI0027400CDB|nr:HalOD1 output domain-containing protein [Natronococcus sp. AD5]
MGYDIDDNEAVSEAVVLAVSSAKERDPCTLRPLYEIINPDALNELSDPKYDGKRRTGANVSFVYSDHRVTIDTSEYITIQPADV